MNKDDVEYMMRDGVFTYVKMRLASLSFSDSTATIGKTVGLLVFTGIKFWVTYAIFTRVFEKLGTEKFFFTRSGDKVFKLVTYFLMKWLSDLSEGAGFETSEVAWLPFEKARKKLKYSSEKKVLDKAKEILDSGWQESLV